VKIEKLSQTTDPIQDESVDSFLAMKATCNLKWQIRKKYSENEDKNSMTYRCFRTDKSSLLVAGRIITNTSKHSV
jgi:hypothetical protein